MLTSGQRRANVGTSVGPTMAADVGPTAFWPAAQRWPNVGKPPKKITHCIASTNQIVHK